MSRIGQPERSTQDRVIALFRDELGYRVLGDRSSRAGNSNAYVPDLPGCVAVGGVRAEVTKLIHEAIEFHVEGMQEDGLSIPEPHSPSSADPPHSVSTSYRRGPQRDFRCFRFYPVKCSVNCVKRTFGPACARD